MKSQCLGLARPECTIPEGFTKQAAADGLAIVSQLGCQERLAHGRACMELADALDPFLPLAPGGGEGDVLRSCVAFPEVWQSALHRVQGCVEIVVTVSWSAAPNADRSQQGWLRAQAQARRDLEAKQANAMDVLKRRLANAGLTPRARRAFPINQGLDIALLVARERIEDVQRAVLGAKALGMNFKVSGPWPCFSFGPASLEIAA